jgi:hypothetical protein
MGSRTWNGLFLKRPSRGFICIEQTRSRQKSGGLDLIFVLIAAARHYGWLGRSEALSTVENG